MVDFQISLGQNEERKKKIVNFKITLKEIYIYINNLYFDLCMI